MEKYPKRLISELILAITGASVFFVFSMGFILVICVQLFEARENQVLGYSAGLILWFVVLSESSLTKDTFSYYIERGFVSEHNYIKTMFIGAMNVLPKRTMICVFYIGVLFLQKMNEVGLIQATDLGAEFLKANEYTIIVVLAVFQLIDSARIEIKNISQDARRFAQLCLLDMKPHGAQIGEIVYGKREKSTTEFEIRGRTGGRIILGVPSARILKLIANDEELLKDIIYDGKDDCFYVTEESFALIRSEIEEVDISS